MFTISNLFTIATSTLTVISSIFDLVAKKERSWLDYYQLCMGLFMFVNVFAKPITVKRLFETEQMAHLNHMKDKLNVRFSKD